MEKNKVKINSLVFLLSPWWKYGKILILGSLISAVIWSPIAGYCSTTLAEAVINVIQAGESFNTAFEVGITYLAIAMFFTLIRALYDDLYFRWKKQEIEGHIEREIYEKALVVDYKCFDKPEYFDSYKLTTEKFVSQSSETLQNIFSLFKEFSCLVVYGSLIASHGLILLLMVVMCSAFVTYAQIYWSKVSVDRESIMVNERRKTDYIRRLFFDHTAIADMRSSNICIPLFGMFNESIKNRILIYKQYGIKEFIIDAMVSIAQLGTTFVVPIYVSWGVMTGDIEGIGVYATLIASSMALKQSLNAIGWWSSQVSLGIAYAQKVKVFFNIESSIESTIIGEIPESKPFAIELKNVKYGYSDSNPVINGINLSIQPGEKIAIVGENGAGKTTLIKLLLRLYDVDSGIIYINKKPISDYNIKSLRNKIGIVFQNSKLYALSVRENMTAYNKASTEQLVKNLDEVDLNLKLDDNVTREFDENGIVLSGGESQKLNLTRIMHGDFGLLILDEPSSALDPIAEYNIAKLMFNDSKTTTIMIAHRLSTVVDADRIYLISNGTIVECGTHKELMNKCGKYKEMFLKQAEGYLKSDDKFILSDK